MEHISLTVGNIRRLSEQERKTIKEKGGDNYYYVVQTDCSYTNSTTGETISIPKGFLTDGSSGGPSWGFSWLFHDYLYGCHQLTRNGELVECTREHADHIMDEILELERHFIYQKIFHFVSWYNFFYIFSNAWKKSGLRKCEMYQNFFN